MAATRQEARDMSRVIKRLVAINSTLKGYRRVDPGEQLVHRFSPKRIAEIKKYACRPRSNPYNRHLDDMLLTDLPLGVLLEDGRRFHALSSSLSLAGPGGFSLLLRGNIAYLPEIILITRDSLKSFNHYPWRRGYLVKKGESIGDTTWYNNDLHGCPLCDCQEDWAMGTDCSLPSLQDAAGASKERKALGTIFDEAWVLPRHSSAPANMIVHEARAALHLPARCGRQ
jgi:hypothetical protein